MFGLTENVGQLKIAFWLTIKEMHLIRKLVYAFIFHKPFSASPKIYQQNLHPLSKEPNTITYPK